MAQVQFEMNLILKNAFGKGFHEVWVEEKNDGIFCIVFHFSAHINGTFSGISLYINTFILLNNSIIPFPFK